MFLEFTRTHPFGHSSNYLANFLGLPFIKVHAGVVLASRAAMNDACNGIADPREEKKSSDSPT